MAQGVFTNDMRINFVAGEVTTGTPTSGFVACGPGTGYPMEIMLLQLAELIYRVKDAWFTSGYVPTIYAPTEEPAARSMITSGEDYQYRGYTFGGVDIGDDESEMWTNDDWNFPHLNAFSYSANDEDSVHAGNDQWFGNATDGARVKVTIGGNVAVVKVDEANGFFDPTNKFYLQIEFWFFNFSTGYLISSYTNIYTGVDGDVSAFAEESVNYVIRLASGDITCPMYLITDLSTAGDDFVHEATEWWPYAKTGGAVWNTATGALL